MSYTDAIWLGLLIGMAVLIEFFRMLSRDLDEEREVNEIRDDAYRQAFLDHTKQIDENQALIAKLAESAASLSERLVELERRIGCCEDDLEKIPVEEVNAEVQRLELFNDGIANIMGYGPDVPKLNKEVLRHE